MGLEALASSLLQPAVLFFLLGAAATAVGSDLEVPAPIPKVLSLYLLAALGYKGAVALEGTELTAQVAGVALVGVAMSALVPLCAWLVLRRRLPVADAASTAAAYGSVSAVTFLAAAAYLERLDIPYGGHVVAVLVLMETPAIVVGLALGRRVGAGSGEPVPWKRLLHDAAFGGPVFLLMGSLVAGVLAPSSALQTLKPFFGDLFPGVLAFFLLDMGLVSARRLRDVLGQGRFLVGFGVVFPLAMGLLGLASAHALSLSVGDATLLAVLCGSASYIAVPVVMRVALPAANPGLYVGLPLGVTFPFNVVAGIPLYHALATLLRS